MRAARLQGMLRFKGSSQGALLRLPISFFRGNSPDNRTQEHRKHHISSKKQSSTRTRRPLGSDYLGDATTQAARPHNNLHLKSIALGERNNRFEEKLRPRRIARTAV